MRVVVNEKIKLTEEELNLLNRANRLLEIIYQEITSDELEELIGATTTYLADVMEYCEIED